jgi:hypothetical protein
MTRPLQNILDFCRYADMDLEEVEKGTFKYSEEEISGIPLVLYLKQQENLELWIEIKGLGMLSLRKKCFSGYQIKVVVVKPRNIIITLEEAETSELLLEISKKVNQVFEIMVNYRDNQSKVTGIQSDDEVVMDQLLFRSFTPENDTILINEDLYSKIFQPPDLWLCDFFLQIEKRPVVNKMNVKLYVENTEQKEIILFKSLTNIDISFDLKTIFQHLDLNFNGKIIITPEFFKCLYQDEGNLFEITLEKTEKSGNPSTFKIFSDYGNISIDYEDKSTFLSKIHQKIMRSISLNVEPD